MTKIIKACEIHGEVEHVWENKGLSYNMHYQCLKCKKAKGGVVDGE